MTNQNKDYSWLDKLCEGYYRWMTDSISDSYNMLLKKDGIDYVLPRILGTGKATPLKPSEFQAAIIAKIDEHYIGKGEAEKIAKAYGGCTKCYGKGYASYTTAHSGTDTDQDIGSPGGRYYKKVDEMRFCSCARGRQLESELEQRCIEARIDGHDVTIKYHYPAEESADYKRGFKAATEQVEKWSERREQELKGRLSTNNKDTKS